MGQTALNPSNGSTTAPLTPPADSAITPSATASATGQSPIEVQKIIVGSRLIQNNVTSPSPVTIVSRRDIENSSAQTVEDVLQNLPSSGSSGIYRTTTNGGEGNECYDLRNLGIQRVLVLINGHRVVHTGIFGSDCVDLSNIPVALVDQIQILKSGASSIYGADAVSGVVNVVLRQDFTGTQLNVDGGISAHGDDRSGDIAATEGFNFDHGKGNFVVAGEYNDQGDIIQANRSWAGQVVTAEPAPGGNYTFGSGIPIGPRIFDSPNVTNSLLPGGGSGALQATPNNVIRPFTDADRFNYSPYQQLLGGLTTSNVTQNGDWNIDPHFQLYDNVFYTHKTALTQLGPQPVTGGLGANLEPDFIIPSGNPYNPFGEDVALYDRLGQFGAREVVPHVDTYQGTLGVKGLIAAGWNYDVNYSYGKSEDTVTSYNEVNYQHLEQEAGARQTFDPNATTPADAVVYDPSVCMYPCTLQNFFGPTSLTQAGINYADFTEQSVATFFLRDLNAGLTNNHLIQLPYGPLGLAIGMEHRGEQGSYHPDPLVESGVTLENSQQPTAGGFNATEVYGELHIPLLKDLPAAKDLSADVSGRYSSYNTFGDAETWQLSGNWTPIDDIRFRGVLGTAFRQPGINELYGGQALSFNTASDPCQGAVGVVATNCAKQGINPATFAQLGNEQVQTITGGNPELQPETARTYTFGTVIQPRFFKNFAATVDYWHTKIDHEISAVSTQTVLNECYDSANLSSAFCNDIAPRNGLQQLSNVTAIDENLGVLKADGIDVGLNYLLPLPNGIDSFTMQSDFSFALAYLAQNVPDGPFTNYNGSIDISGGAAYPRVRNSSSITWNHNRFSLEYRLRYIDGMNYLYADGYGPGITRDYKTNEVFYHDIEANYRFKKVNLVAGIDNIGNRQPPFVPDGSSNTATYIYDVIGTYFYVKTQFKF